MDQKEIISFLEFDDIKNQDPNYEPYVILEGFKSIQPENYKELFLYHELMVISTLMIPKDQKERALNEINEYSLTTLPNGIFIENEAGELLRMTMTKSVIN